MHWDSYCHLQSFMEKVAKYDDITITNEPEFKDIFVVKNSFI